MPIGIFKSDSQTRIWKSDPNQHDAQRLFGTPFPGIENTRCVTRGRRAVFYELRIRPAAGHVLEAGLLIARIVEGKTGKAAVGDHDQRHAERTRMETVTNDQTAAAQLPLARRHRFVGDEQVMQA